MCYSIQKGRIKPSNTKDHICNIHRPCITQHIKYLSERYSDVITSSACEYDDYCMNNKLWYIYSLNAMLLHHGNYILNCETYYNDIEHVCFLIIYVRSLCYQFKIVTGKTYICFDFSVYI